MEVHDWMEQCRNLHITVGDVRNLNVGDELTVVMWDGNYEEYKMWDIPENENRNAEDMFSENKAKLIYKSDSPPTWDIEYIWEETIEHPVHVNVEHLRTTWTWCALESDGYIHITNECINADETLANNYPDYRPTHIHWDDFDDNIRAGWRGPMMKWEHLADTPAVYWNRAAINR